MLRTIQAREQGHDARSWHAVEDGASETLCGLGTNDMIEWGHPYRVVGAPDRCKECRKKARDRLGANVSSSDI